MHREEILSKVAAGEITVEEAQNLLDSPRAPINRKARSDAGTTNRQSSGIPIDNMIEAIGIEIEAIKKNTRSSVLELRGGIKQGMAGSDTLYSFPLAEEPNLRDDSPVKIVVAGKEIDGSVVSVRNGILTVSLVEDLDAQIPLARLVVNDSFLVERLRDKLVEVKNGEAAFNPASAESVLSNKPGLIGETDVHDGVFTIGNSLNEMQRAAVRRSAGSSLLYLWGPPGTGKTSTLAAIVHELYLQGKSILIVSNTNIAVDTALERIGDRLATMPEFHEAAVLRFGPIVSDTLRSKYESQVDLDKAVERLSAALVKQKVALKQEANTVQSAATKLQSALAEYSQLHAGQAELKQI